MLTNTLRYVTWSARIYNVSLWITWMRISHWGRSSVGHPGHLREDPLPLIGCQGHLLQLRAFVFGRGMFEHGELWPTCE